MSPDELEQLMFNSGLEKAYFYKTKNECKGEFRLINK